MGFFAFMDLWSQTRFSVCGYRCVNGLGFQRDGKSLGFWVSNRGESALLAHDFPLESLVCYTFCDRWRWKGGVSLQNTPFPVAAEQADFATLRGGESEICFQQNPPVRV